MQTSSVPHPSFSNSNRHSNQSRYVQRQENATAGVLQVIKILGRLVRLTLANFHNLIGRSCRLTASLSSQDFQRSSIKFCSAFWTACYRRVLKVLYFEGTRTAIKSSVVEDRLEALA